MSKALWRAGEGHRPVWGRGLFPHGSRGEETTPADQGTPSRPTVDRDGSDRAIHVAVVHGSMEVHFIVAAGTRQELIGRLAGRLAREAEVQLWEEEIRRFENLRFQGRVEEAVEYYFSKVGDRWDPAFLSIHALPE